MVSRVNQLKLRKSIDNQAKRGDKAETIGVKILGEGSLMDDGTDNEMGNQQSVQLLDDPDRMQRT